MKLYTTTFATPFGWFSAAVADDGAVAATAFHDGTHRPYEAQDQLRRRLRVSEPVTFVVDCDRTSRVREQVLAYASGDRDVFDVDLRPPGSGFQQRLWRALRGIPVGETRSYDDLARALGSAPRAVGRANAVNPICLLIPCHRVIGKDGSLTGFAFGIDLKRRLLEHERTFASE